MCRQRNRRLSPGVTEEGWKLEASKFIFANVIGTDIHKKYVSTCKTQLSFSFLNFHFTILRLEIRMLWLVLKGRIEHIQSKTDCPLLYSEVAKLFMVTCRPEGKSSHASIGARIVPSAYIFLCLQIYQKLPKNF